MIVYKQPRRGTQEFQKILQVQKEKKKEIEVKKQIDHRVIIFSHAYTML